MVGEEFQEAKRLLRIADHMTFVTYPVLREKRLMIKIIEQIDSAMKKTISSILSHEYIQKNVKKYDDPKQNYDEFLACSPAYNITDSQLKTIKQLSNIVELHKKSPMEFIRKDSFVIMSDSMHMEQITIERIKIFLKIAQEIVQNTEIKFIKDKGFN